MMIPEGTCEQCEFGEECMIVRNKLYGKNGGSRGRRHLDDQATTPVTPIEELIEV